MRRVAGNKAVKAGNDGVLLGIGIEGTTLGTNDRRRLSHPAVALVILFQRNYASPAQLRTLVSQIHELRPDMLISVDHEGGRVQRFRHNGFTHLPALHTLGQHYYARPQQTLHLLEAHARILATELAQCGIDFSYTPCVDLYQANSPVINDRAFSACPYASIEMARHYIQTLANTGMAGVIKHFPGHGCTQADSHYETAVNNKNLGDLRTTELLPFAALAGHYNQPAAVMSAHVCYPHIDSEIATFSPFWLRTVLREELGFTGLIISDDMGMFAAQSNHYTIDKQLRRFYQAGGDLALLCNHFAVMDQVLEQLPDSTDPKPARQERLNLLYNRHRNNSLPQAIQDNYQRDLSILRPYTS